MNIFFLYLSKIILNKIVLFILLIFINANGYISSIIFNFFLYIKQLIDLFSLKQNKWLLLNIENNFNISGGSKIYFIIDF